MAAFAPGAIMVELSTLTDQMGAVGAMMQPMFEHIQPHGIRETYGGRNCV